MPSPFPGMDPWLEHSDFFPDVHDTLVTYIRDTLNSSLPAPYFASIATRVWIEASERMIGPDVKLHHDESFEDRSARNAGATALAEAPTTEGVVIQVPHDEIREPFVEVHGGADGQRLVTSIEVLSLTNKRPGEHGRDLYRKKQREILESQVHLVEIDLLRGGTHTTAVPRPWAERRLGPFDYHVSVRHFERWGEFVVYAWRLEKKFPSISIPLLPGDAHVRIDLQPLFDRCYDAGLYSRRVRYRNRRPEPSLTLEQQQWADHILSQNGL